MTDENENKPTEGAKIELDQNAPVTYWENRAAINEWTMIEFFNVIGLFVVGQADVELVAQRLDELSTHHSEALAELNRAFQQTGETDGE